MWLAAVAQSGHAEGVVPGDNLITLWVNPWTRHLRQMRINTTFQGSPVQMQNYNYARLGY